MDRIEEIAAEIAGGRVTRWRSPASRSCSTPTARTSARCSSSSTTSTTGAIPSCTATRSPDQLRSSSGRRSPRRMITVFGAAAGRGRRHAPAGSRSWSRTAATSASTTLQEQTENLVDDGQASDARACVGLFTGLPRQRPALFVDVDRERVHDARASRSQDVFDTLQIYLGSLYVNDFNLFGRTWQVIVQADAELPQPDRGRQAAQGPQRPRATMVPLGALAERPRGQRPAGPDRATTCTPPPPINGTAGAGRQLGPGDRR